MRFIYDDYRSFIIYFVIALVVACFLLLNPFFLLLGQIEGAVVFYVCYHISVGGQVTLNGVMFILSSFFIVVEKDRTGTLRCTIVFHITESITHHHIRAHGHRADASLLSVQAVAGVDCNVCYGFLSRVRDG